MTYDPQAGLKAREAANYSGEEKGAYVLGYDAGYYMKTGSMSKPFADPVGLKYPNAYSAGYWDGYSDTKADIVARVEKARRSQGMSSETFALLLFALFVLGMCHHG